MPRALLISLVLAAVALGLVGAAVSAVGSGAPPIEEPVAQATVAEPAEEPVDAAEAPVDGAVEAPPEAAPEPTREPHPLVDRSSVGEPWGEGLTTFRGNPTRTWYGRGPVPRGPEVVWRYPQERLCTIEATSEGEHRWCGTGWTGQPLVRVLEDGRTEVIVGAYDGAVHFIDGDSGTATRPPFRTGHMVKGTESLDPDGYPLLYTGSRDGYLRIVALDRDVPTELWALGAHAQRVWNNDWDGSPAVVDDVMYVGGEDSWFYAVRIHRGYDADGHVTVEPEVILEVPGWTDELIAEIGDHNVSIESSVALFEGRAYFANSGGRVVGLDVADVQRTGEAPVVFEFLTGDDTDATITIDEDGMLYVAVELQRFLPRAQEVGQLIKLDPYTDGDPLVWSVEVPPDLRPWMDEDDGGIWASPALHRGVLFVTTHPGDLLAVDTQTGEVVYEERVGYHEWGSPVVVDDTLVVPMCAEGGLRAYDVSDPRQPRERWTFTLPSGACIESTPAVWDGRIYVGSRDGFIYGIGDR